MDREMDEQIWMNGHRSSWTDRTSGWVDAWLVVRWVDGCEV